MGSIFFFAIEKKKKARSKKRETRTKSREEVELFAVRFLCACLPQAGLCAFASNKKKETRYKKQEPRDKSQEPRGLSLVSCLPTAGRILASCFYYSNFYFPEMKQDYPSIAA
jgi:hypothetical protein